MGKASRFDHSWEDRLSCDCSLDAPVAQRAAKGKVPPMSKAPQCGGTLDSPWSLLGCPDINPPAFGAPPPPHSSCVITTTLLHPQTTAMSSSLKSSSSSSKSNTSLRQKFTSVFKSKNSSKAQYKPSCETHPPSSKSCAFAESRA